MRPSASRPYVRSFGSVHELPVSSRTTRSCPATTRPAARITWLESAATRRGPRRTRRGSRITWSASGVSCCASASSRREAPKTRSASQAIPSGRLQTWRASELDPRVPVAHSEGLGCTFGPRLHDPSRRLHATRSPITPSDPAVDRSEPPLHTPRYLVAHSDPRGTHLERSGTRSGCVGTRSGLAVGSYEVPVAHCEVGGCTLRAWPPTVPACGCTDRQALRS